MIDGVFRGLFPDDNFSEERYNQKPNKSSVAVNSGTRIMKIKRGFSEEADLLLDYLVYLFLAVKYMFIHARTKVFMMHYLRSI